MDEEIDHRILPEHRIVSSEMPCCTFCGVPVTWNAARLEWEHLEFVRDTEHRAELLDPDWVVANAVTQEMTCRRCGGHEPLPKDMLLQWAADIMGGFVRRHADCEPDDLPHSIR